MREQHKLAGKTVKTKDGDDFRVEDWVENVSGKSVWAMNGNPAALIYAMHVADKHLPIDCNAVYGKIGGMGVILHDSELVG